MIRARRARRPLAGATRLARKTVAMAVLTPLLRQEWEHGAAVPHTERALAYAFALRWISDAAPRNLLDVGTGQSAWPHIVASTGVHVTAVDNYSELYGRGPSWWRRTRFFNRHYYVIDDDISDSAVTERFDFATCLSVLELVDDHERVVRGMFDRLLPGARLAVSVPYNDAEFVDNAYALPDAGFGWDLRYRCRQYSNRELTGWLQANGATLVEMNVFRCFTGPYWTVGDRLPAPVPAAVDEPHHLACMLLEKR